MAQTVERDLLTRPTFNVVKAQKKAMAASVKESGLSREQVVDMMNNLAGLYGISLSTGNDKALTRVTLDKWLNVNELDRQMPARVVPVFCKVVGNHSALDILAKTMDCQVIDSKQRKMLRWAEPYHRVQRNRKEMAQLEEIFND